MRTSLPIRSVLSLFFLASVAMAGAPDARLEVRTLLLSDHPFRATHKIHVSGQVTTVLRFEQDCDPARTKLLGWEGRFEPLLVGGRKVVLEPLRDLGEDERIPLLVTLVDGTEIPFLVSPPRSEEWGWTRPLAASRPVAEWRCVRMEPRVHRSARRKQRGRCVT